MIIISKKTLEKNRVEVIVNKNSKKQLNQGMQRNSYNINLAATTLKYFSKYRKQRKELVSCNNLQPYRSFSFQKLAIKVIMDCKTATVEFRTKVGFNQYDSILITEKLILTKIMKEFSGEEILLQHYALNYKTDLYLPKHRLVIEVDEFDNIGTNDDNEREEKVK